MAALQPSEHDGKPNNEYVALSEPWSTGNRDFDSILRAALDWNCYLIVPYALFALSGIGWASTKHDAYKDCRSYFDVWLHAFAVHDKHVSRTSIRSDSSTAEQKAKRRKSGRTHVVDGVNHKEYNAITLPGTNSLSHFEVTP